MGTIRHWLGLLVLGVFAFALNARAEEEPARITNIERYGSEKAARIVVHLSRPIEFRAGSTAGADANTGQPYVDFVGASYAGMHSFELVGLVERVRLLPMGAAYRLVMDLAGPARHTAFYLPAPFRIVIDVSRPEPIRGASPSGRVVERIALDPGHGGADPGATGSTGIREKDIVLDIAHRAAPLLARELGISTLLTRDLDVRVPLEERVARANAFGADLFVSIHCNADGSRAGRGVMTFVLDGSHDQRVSSVLARENFSLDANPAELTRFLQQFDDTATARHSTTFAHLLQRATLASLAAGYPRALDGGVHGAGFHVLAGAHMPAVLFETSFVSNLLEEQRLATPRYRQKLADAIVNAVKAYRAGYPSPPTR
jgi:N-acetylmuramoyl-L-alanine amidase